MTAETNFDARQVPGGEALWESEERFRAVAASTPDHILMQDLDLRYQLVINPQLGLTEADMLGKTDYDFLRNRTRIRLPLSNEKSWKRKNRIH